MASFFDHPLSISRTVDRVMFGTAFIGAIVGVVLHCCEFWFLDAWLGGAIGMPIGLALGVAYERRQASWDDHCLPRVYVVGVLSVAVALLGVSNLLPMVNTAKANVNLLSTLQPKSLTKIRVRKPFSNASIVTIDDRQALNDFVIAARDMRVGYPGQLSSGESFDEWWFVIVLADSQEIELEWSHRGRSPNTVFGMFVETNRRSLKNRGSWLSTNLRAWFSQYVETALE